MDPAQEGNHESSSRVTPKDGERMVEQRHEGKLQVVALASLDKMLGRMATERQRNMIRERSRDIDNVH